ITDKATALERALKVVRTRIDEFGVAEPVVQKVGNDRIIVELPGIDDPQRATQVVQKSALLQFQITDKTGALERVKPRLDGIVKERHLGRLNPDVRSDTGKGTGFKSLFSGADTSKKKAATDTGTAANGPFARLVQADPTVPGLYLVASTDQ